MMVDVFRRGPHEITPSLAADRFSHFAVADILLFGGAV
jgi:hypothetical protein